VDCDLLKNESAYRDTLPVPLQCPEPAAHAMNLPFIIANPLLAFCAAG